MRTRGLILSNSSFSPQETAKIERAFLRQDGQNWGA